MPAIEEALGGSLCWGSENGILLGMWVSQSYCSLGEKGCWPGWVSRHQARCSLLLLANRSLRPCWALALCLNHLWSEDTEKRHPKHRHFLDHLREKCFLFLFLWCIKLTGFPWLGWRAVFLHVCAVSSRNAQHWLLGQQEETEGSFVQLPLSLVIFEAGHREAHVHLFPAQNRSEAIVTRLLCGTEQKYSISSRSSECRERKHKLPSTLCSS